MSIPRKKTAYQKETHQELGFVLLTGVCCVFCLSYITLLLLQ